MSPIFRLQLETGLGIPLTSNNYNRVYYDMSIE